MDNIHENIKEQNLNKEQKMLMVFDDTVADMLRNKKLQQILKKSKHASCFYYRILFCCTRNIRQNSTYYFVIKISKK